MHFGEGNIKSKNTEDVLFLTWSLPSVKTCPYSTEKCRNRCFAKKNENFKNVLNSRIQNLQDSKLDNFVEIVIQFLEKYITKKKSENKIVFVRIHTSGDFYDLEYLKKWIEITDYFKDNNKISFQAYTKSITILKEYIDKYNKNINDINIHFVYSIWEDTKIKDINIAKNYNLQTFTTIPLHSEKEYENKGYFICKGNCGICKQCYTNIKDKIAITIH